nr:aldolase/citrate lyase family protein [Oryzisolibacter propanilivorax]
MVTETARSIAGLGSYGGCCDRLWGMLWGGEDLSADLGAHENREQGRYTSPYRMARDLCLFSARAAGVLPIDAVYTEVGNIDGLKAETSEGRRDGFAAKAVIHPSHVQPVNDAFGVSAAQAEWARRIVQAFRDDPQAGVINLDGQMIDRPHLVRAQRMLDAASN